MKEKPVPKSDGFVPKLFGRDSSSLSIGFESALACLLASEQVKQHILVHVVQCCNVNLSHTARVAGMQSKSKEQKLLFISIKIMTRVL
jgi:hypothetical protein